MATWQHLRSSTANKRPTTSLADGRIAINTNTASPGLFFKDSAGTGIVKVGPVHVGTTAPNSVPASGGSSGNYTGEQWLDTSVSPAQMKVWNGSTWVGIVADELPVSKLQDGAARQLIQTDAAGTGVEWTSNVDVPGTLDVTSTATFDSIAQHPLGTAGAPTITFTGDTNTGLYSPGADQVAISTNGTGRLFVDASGNVKVSTGEVFNTSATGYIRVAGGDDAGSGASILAFGQSHGSAAGRLVLTAVGSESMQFGAGGAERMRLDSSGRLGLGTSSPSAGYLLDVRGSMYMVGTNSRVYVDNGGIGGSSVQIGVSGTSHGYIGTDGNFPLVFQPNNTERVRITSAGSVGIGTNAASERLHVVGGNSRFEGNYVSFNNNGYIRTDATNELRLQAGSSGTIFANSGNSEIGRWDSSGRFLVGTSTSASTGNGYTPGLQVAAQSGSISASSYRSDEYGGIIALQKSKSATVGTQTIVSNNDQLGLLSFEGSDGTNFEVAAQIQAYVDGTPGANDMPGRLVFSTTADGASSPTERMRITSTGDVYFGTTTVNPGIGNTATGTLIRNGTADSDRYIAVSRNAGAGLFVNRNTNDGSVCDFARAGTSVGTISVTASATAYNTSSDYRLKENVLPLTGAVNRLNQLQVHRFNFIADPSKTVDGFLAHEAQAVVPECVTGTKDEVDADGKPVYQGIDQSKLVPLLTAALQEALAEIESLKARVTALEP